MARWIGIILIVAGLAGAESKTRLTIARGNAPTLDGTLQKPEWDGATRVDLGDGNALYWRHDDKHVYLGLQTTAGIVTVFAHVGKKIYALHSSARLGTAVYGRDDAAWKNERAFKYKPDSDAFLKAEGWRATTMQTGKRGQMEFVLSHKLLGLTAKQRAVRVAVAVFGRPTLGWPVVAKDVTAHGRLLMGYTPAQLTFAPQKWALIELSKPKPQVKTKPGSQPSPEPKPKSKD